jgi:hypothetical protein
VDLDSDGSPLTAGGEDKKGVRGRRKREAKEGGKRKARRTQDWRDPAL